MDNYSRSKEMMLLHSNQEAGGSRENDKVTLVTYLDQPNISAVNQRNSK